MLEFYRAGLANTQIRAPFSGTVVKKMAEVGESVAPIPPGREHLDRFGRHRGPRRPRHPRGRGRRGGVERGEAGADQPAEVTAEAFPDRKYKARLRQVIPTADRTKATVQVKVTILDKDKDLKPEMSAQVSSPRRRRREGRGGRRRPLRQPVVPAPESAIVTRDGKSVAFEIREGAAQARPVDVGTKNGGPVAIKERPVWRARPWWTRPPNDLKDGDAVRAKAN